MLDKYEVVEIRGKKYIAHLVWQETPKAFWKLVQLQTGVSLRSEVKTVWKIKE